MLRFAANLGARAVARATPLIAAAALSLALPARAGNSRVDVSDCTVEDAARAPAAVARRELPAARAHISSCLGFCGVSAGSDGRARSATAVPMDDERTSVGAPRSDHVLSGRSMGVATGVTFVVGGAFASVFGFARARWARSCVGCAAAEERAKELSPKTDGTWGYVAMGVHAAALLGMIVLSASTDEAPTSEQTRRTRVDSLRLAIAPTVGGGALSFSGRF
jgi:hypothetical protein